MAGVIFSHPNSFVGDLSLRAAPVSIEYEYNLNTNRVATHGGEVVQLLSINFNKLIMDGRFGIEGPHGRTVKGNKNIGRPIAEFFDLDKGRSSSSKQPYQIGLTQMTEYFRRYFQVAGQGGVETIQHNLIRANHDQQPMTIRYQTDIEQVMRRWTGYPVAFPSYARSEDQDFAPVWHVEFEIEEPDKLVLKQGLPAELARLRDAVGYEAYNPFSDPTGAFLENKQLTGLDPKKALKFGQAQAKAGAAQAYDELLSIVGATDPTDIAGLIKLGASYPSTTPHPSKVKKGDTAHGSSISTTKKKKGSSGSNTRSTDDIADTSSNTDVQGFTGNGMWAPGNWKPGTYTPDQLVDNANLGLTYAQTHKTDYEAWVKRTSNGSHSG